MQCSPYPYAPSICRYPTDFELDANGIPAKRKWQWVILLPFSDQTRVLKVLKEVCSHSSFFLSTAFIVVLQSQGPHSRNITYERTFLRWSLSLPRMKSAVTPSALSYCSCMRSPLTSLSPLSHLPLSPPLTSFSSPLSPQSHAVALDARLAVCTHTSFSKCHDRFAFSFASRLSCFKCLCNILSCV
jgi:hypothetical protein